MFIHTSLTILRLIVGLLGPSSLFWVTSSNNLSTYFLSIFFSQAGSRERDKCFVLVDDDDDDWCSSYMKMKRMNFTRKSNLTVVDLMICQNSNAPLLPNKSLHILSCIQFRRVYNFLFFYYFIFIILFHFILEKWVNGPKSQKKIMVQIMIYRRNKYWYDKIWVISFQNSGWDSRNLHDNKIFWNFVKDFDLSPWMTD